MSTDPFADPAHLIPATGRLRRSRTKWRVLFFVALAIAVLAIAGRFWAEQTATGEHIARIGITGVITTDRDRTRTLRELGENPLVRAVVIAINSPGGTTAGGEELYESLLALGAKKPVVAVISELGASAAYMTAIATDRIFARRLSMVGSIGVIYQHVNAGRLLETIGVEYDKVRTGPLKAEPDIASPLEGLPRIAFQALVDDSFAWFVDIVAERRELERDAALALSDGRVFTGRQAIEAGLIDAVGGERDAIDWLVAERNVPDVQVFDYYPLPSGGLFDPAQWLGQAARATLGLEPSGPMALDGLVSLWHAGQTP